ncbi:MAG: hypothetical protein ACYC61_31080 [Isosphaeraceae bacterium]
MPVDPETWGLLPTAVAGAKAALENREKISGALEWIAAKLMGKKRAIAFTGRPGVGKSVLFDYLRHKADARGYKPPPPSESVETAKIKAPGIRVDLSVIPGDHSSPRREALLDLFNPKDPVHGVIHVVADGFTEIRGQYSPEVVAEMGKLATIEQFRNRQKRLELEDLDETCEAIRDAIRRSKEPSWMIVAVTKIDLYYSEMAAARNYYSPSGKGAFAKRLRRLQSQVGSDNFRWMAVPVCAELKDFTWNDQVVSSALDERARDEYIQDFSNTLERYCGRTD